MIHADQILFMPIASEQKNVTETKKAESDTYIIQDD